MALACPAGERPVISLDMAKMSAIEWIDPVTKTACIQGGAVGRILEEQLREHGFTLGHEPDSIEFSTMGGWVATAASGMKKNRYGNIEDIVQDVTIVTREGAVNHPGSGARVSHGLDVRKLAIGSEGMLGVITRCIVKVHRAPEVQRYGSLVFPTWADGLAFMEEISGWQAAPASVRLVDNMQFQFGRALKPSNSSPLMQEIQKLFVTKIHGVDLEQMVACTLVYEGDDEEQRALESRVVRAAKGHGGFGAGGAAGKDGYNLTFGIAYIRDFLLQYWTLGDSFETSVPWGKVDAVVDGVKKAIAKTHKEFGLEGHAFVTARVSQVYQTGCCVYFYIGFHYKGAKDPLAAFRKLEHDARVAILDAGGALSHHHGIGKVRADYLDRVKSPQALEWASRAQKALDPDGIFATGNQRISRS
jgi:alkyldihydroxyacetonephosphate synthase